MKAPLELVPDDGDPERPAFAAEPSSGVRETEPSLIDARYRILGRVGMGGMGVVYRADDVWLGRPLALKLLQPASQRDQEALDDFKKEARVLARVRHENIVQVYAFGPHETSFYLAMEYVDGKDLDEIIEEHTARGAVVEPERAISIIRHVGRGLAAIHALGIVHRDVKPSNIVIEADTGRPVLVDFGLARRRTDTNPKFSCPGGTPTYMAPEQAMDTTGTSASARSDLYSLACTTFELLTGRPLFPGTDAYEVLASHVNDAPPKLSSVRPELAPLDAVLLRALSKSPADRHESCAAFAEELGAAAAKVVPAPHRLRVVVWECDERSRRQTTRVAARALHATGDAVEIVSVTTADELTAEIALAPVDIVVIDEESASFASDSAIRTLRATDGAVNAEVIVLDRDWNAGAARFDALGACELPKPVNHQVLASVLVRLAKRVSARRSGNDPPPSSR